MARKPGADLVYNAAHKFKERCLGLGTSLLWPSTKAWTENNLVGVVMVQSIAHSPVPPPTEIWSPKDFPADQLRLRYRDRRNLVNVGG
jgi:hypothetical protein